MNIVTAEKDHKIGRVILERLSYDHIVNNRRLNVTNNIKTDKTDKIKKFLILYIVGNVLFLIYALLAGKSSETIILEFLQANGLGLILSAFLVFVE